jgi:hypothetical protein
MSKKATPLRDKTRKKPISEDKMDPERRDVPILDWYTRYGNESEWPSRSVIIISLDSKQERYISQRH